MAKMGSQTNHYVSLVIGLLLVIVLTVALAPTMFSGINSTNIPGAPSFFITILPLMIAIALIFVIWRFVSHE